MECGRLGVVMAPAQSHVVVERKKDNARALIPSLSTAALTVPEVLYHPRRVTHRTVQVSMVYYRYLKRSHVLMTLFNDVILFFLVNS